MSICFTLHLDSSCLGYDTNGLVQYSLKTKAAHFRNPGRLHYEMIHCPQMSSIKYHQPTNKVLLTSKEPGRGLSLCVFTPPMDTTPDQELHWILGEGMFPFLLSESLFRSLFVTRHFQMFVSYPRLSIRLTPQQ